MKICALFKSPYSKKHYNKHFDSHATIDLRYAEKKRCINASRKRSGFNIFKLNDNFYS